MDKPPKEKTALKPVELKALELELARLQALADAYTLLKEMVTVSGFIRLFYTSLPKHPTNKACFDKLNEKYYELTGQYRYSSYSSFQVQLNRYLGKR